MHHSVAMTAFPPCKGENAGVWRGALPCTTGKSPWPPRRSPRHSHSRSTCTPSATGAAATARPAAPTPAPAPAVNATISRIAFGSCSTQDEPQGILRTVLEWKPELFIYMGDNIYGDTRDMRVLQQRYDTLGRRPEFQQLRAAVPLIATWDDHDYGENDAGREYPLKKESKETPAKELMAMAAAKWKALTDDEKAEFKAQMTHV